MRELPKLPSDIVYWEINLDTLEWEWELRDCKCKPSTPEGMQASEGLANSDAFRKKSIQLTG